MSARIKQRYPVTASAIRFSGPRAEIIERHFPPSYKSKTGRVKRWTEDAAAKCASVGFGWGIRGDVRHLRIVPITSRMNMRKLRAFGTHDQMAQLLSKAVRMWHELPGGREIETLFDQMFPAKLELKPDETITDRKKLKAIKKKPASAPPVAAAPSSREPVDHPALI